MPSTATGKQQPRLNQAPRETPAGGGLGLICQNPRDQGDTCGIDRRYFVLPGLPIPYVSNYQAYQQCEAFKCTVFFTSEGWEPHVQTGQVTPAPQPRSRFPAICTICSHDIIGWGTSPAWTPQMAFPAQILLPPRAIMTSLAHLDADCPNTHHCQHTEIAVSTVITYHFLKGCSFSTHTAHRGVNTDKEHAELCSEGKSILTFLGQRAVRKKGKGVLLPPVTQSTFGGGRNAADPTSSHHRTSCKACYCT